MKKLKIDYHFDTETWTCGNITIETDRMNYFDTNGNPRYFIYPLGYLTDLPKLDGFRRSNAYDRYSVTTYNIEETVYNFFEQLEGKKILMNFDTKLEYKEEDDKNE